MNRLKLLFVAVLIAIPCMVNAFDFWFSFGGGRITQWEDLAPVPTYSCANGGVFGNVSTSSYRETICTLSIGGTDGIEAALLTVTNDAGSTFSESERTCDANPFDLALLGTCTATVRFTPSSAIEFTGFANMTAPNVVKQLVALSGTGTSTEPELLSRSDDFNRANENPLAGNWSAITGLGSFKIVSNVTRPVSSTDSAMYWSGDTFSDDHCSKVTVNVTSYGGRPIVRASSTDKTWYNLMYTNDTTIRVTKYVAGSASVVGATFTNSWSTGQNIELCSSGTTTTTLDAYINGSLAFTRTDSSSPITSGQPGISADQSDGSSFDNWEGREQ